jgi:hypothetical protein
MRSGALGGVAVAVGDEPSVGVAVRVGVGVGVAVEVVVGVAVAVIVLVGVDVLLPPPLEVACTQSTCGDMYPSVVASAARYCR